MTPYRKQGGFAYIAAVVLLVVVAGVIAGVLRLTASQQATANDAVLIARAGQAARGGIEWMMYRIGTDAASAPCPADTVSAPTATPVGDFRNASGFNVTVTCGFRQYKEGVDQAGAAVVKNIYTIDAVACNGNGASCPDNAGAGAPDYTERRRVATICLVQGGGFCY